MMQRRLSRQDREKLMKKAKAIAVFSIFLLSIICSFASGQASASLDKRAVKIWIQRVQQLDPMDTLDAADFYWKVKVGSGTTYTSSVYTNQRTVDLGDNWARLWELYVDTTNPTVTVKIDLWDDDLAIDDRCDISKQLGKNGATIYLNPITGAWWGDDNYNGDWWPGCVCGEDDYQTGDWNDAYVMFWISCWDI